MMTDFRALCAELVAIEDALTGRAPVTANQGQALDGFSALAQFRDIAERARAALAQPEPQGPTDEELRQLADKYWNMAPDQVCVPVFLVTVWDFARAVLARWGNR